MKEIALEGLGKRRNVYDSKLEKILDAIYARPKPKGPGKQKRGREKMKKKGNR